MFVLVCLLFVTSFQISVGGNANVAYHKKTTQSSTYKVFRSYLAVDGKSDLRFSHGSCSHTSCRDNFPYWGVDLGKSYYIKSVSIANPIEARERLVNFMIHIYTTSPFKGDHSKNPPPLCYRAGNKPMASGRIHVFTCAKVHLGRWVLIQRKIHKSKQPCFGAMLLCEVKVTTGTATCIPGFRKIGLSCYHFSRFAADDWFQARVACLAMGADLAVLDSWRQDIILKTYMNSVKKTLGLFYFIGGQSLIEGRNKFVWVDPNARPFSHHRDWASYPTKPNILNVDCVTMSKLKGFRWVYLSCFTSQHFLCKQKPVYR